MKSIVPHLTTQARIDRNPDGNSYVFANFSRLFSPKGASRKHFAPLFTFQCGETKFLSSSASRHQAAQIAKEFRRERKNVLAKS